MPRYVPWDGHLLQTHGEAPTNVTGQLYCVEPFDGRSIPVQVQVDVGCSWCGEVGSCNGPATVIDTTCRVSTKVSWDLEEVVSMMAEGGGRNSTSLGLPGRRTLQLIEPRSWHGGLTTRHDRCILVVVCHLAVLTVSRGSSTSAHSHTPSSSSLSSGRDARAATITGGEGFSTAWSRPHHPSDRPSDNLLLPVVP